MNFLAHAYLSFNHPEILVGNMISDFVKGKAKFTYPEPIQQGIMLHRAIDSFTDTHEATAKAKTFFRPDYRLYSGAIVDILYDHFLANDTQIFTEETLKIFTADVYQTLEQDTLHLPQNFIFLLPYMKTEDWLYHYRFKEGIFKSLRGLIRRSAFLSDYQTAMDLFQQHYTALADCYTVFFEDVKTFSQKKIAQLNL
jgi:acyl carrier protein phosphodiesterase